MRQDIIFILILLIPTGYALWDDRNGDVHPNNDWLKIGGVMIICSVIVSLLDHRIGFWINMLRTFLMSFALYGLIFNWAVVWMLVKRGIIELPKGVKWFNYFSKTSWPDNWMIWNTLRWWQRLLTQLLIFCWPAVLYFCPCKIQSYYNQCFICQ